MTKPMIVGGGVFVLLVGVVFFYVNILSGNKEKINNDSKISEVDIVADAPVGCPKSTSIVVKSEEAGTQEISTTNSNFIHWRIDQGMLVFTNYTLEPDSVYSDITGDKVLAVIKLSREDTGALTTGVYRKTAETGKENPNLFSSEFNILIEGLTGAVFDNNSTVTVKYLGDDYICGTVSSDDGKSSINGDFIAKYLNKM